MQNGRTMTQPEAVRSRYIEAQRARRRLSWRDVGCQLAICSATVYWSCVYIGVMLMPWLAMRAVKCFQPARYHRFIRWIIVGYGRLIVKVAWFPLIRVRYRDYAPSCAPGIVVFHRRSSVNPLLASLLDSDLALAMDGWPKRSHFMQFFAPAGAYIDISRRSYAALRTEVAALHRAGVTLVCFPPENHFGHGDGNHFGSGMFKIAMELGIPVYPAAIVGDGPVPGRRWRFRPGRIVIHRLPAVNPAECGEGQPLRLKQEIHRLIYAETRRMERGNRSDEPRRKGGNSGCNESSVRSTESSDAVSGQRR